MSNIVKGVVMNNKYLLLYNEYMLNNMFHLTNSNNRTRVNYKGCCDDCDGSCVGGSGGSSGSGGSKYRQVNIFNNALALPRPSALSIPRPSALVVVKSSVPQSLFSKLCSSDNIHNDCICL
uniref:Uncharacterized protein n=1 Tax=viral metagenome TaxID=1070528 RepID=A0A6C0K7J8_9ZZZZ